MPIERDAASAGLARSLSMPVQGATLGNKTVVAREGLAIPMGTPGSFDDYQANGASVLLDGGTYKMWYDGCDPSYYCQIGYATSPDGRMWTKFGPVLSPSLPEDNQEAADPTVVRVGTQYWMWYDGYDGANFRILAANSTDGVTWTKHGVVLGAGAPGSDDSYEAIYPTVLYSGGTFRMYYSGLTGPSPPNAQILLATSTDGLSWTKVGVVLPRGPPGSLDAYNLFTAGVVFDGSAYEMVYMGQSNDQATRLFFAQSADGVAWSKVGVALQPSPPAESFIFQPYILPLANGTWYVYYTARSGISDRQVYLAWKTEDLWAPVTRSSIQAAPGDHGWWTSTATLFLTAEDNLSGVRATYYSINGGSWQAYAIPLTFADGEHQVRYYSADNVNNSEAIHPIPLNVDTHAPSLAITAPGPHVSSSGVTVAWTASDVGSGIDHYEVSVDGAPYRNVGANTSTVVLLSDGAHSIRVQAVDVAGNSASALTAVTVDTNLFSLQGPLLGLPLYVLIAVGFVLLAMGVDRFAREPRRKS